MNSVSNINERLKEARINLGLKQSEVAVNLNIQQKSISEIENGHIQNIPNTYIYYFFKKSISLKWIYEGSGEMFISDDSIKKESKIPLKNKYNKTFENNSLSDLFNDDKIDKDFAIKVDRSNDYFYERIIKSKNFSIKTLLKLIEHQEKTIEMLKK